MRVELYCDELIEARARLVEHENLTGAVRFGAELIVSVGGADDYIMLWLPHDAEGRERLITALRDLEAVIVDAPYEG